MAELNRRKIVARLEREGWVNRGGGRHDIFARAGTEAITIPRHNTLTPGVARKIARSAGWD